MESDKCKDVLLDDFMLEKKYWIKKNAVRVGKNIRKSIINLFVWGTKSDTKPKSLLIGNKRDYNDGE